MSYEVQIYCDVHSFCTLTSWMQECHGNSLFMTETANNNSHVLDRNFISPVLPLDSHWGTIIMEPKIWPSKAAMSLQVLKLQITTCSKSFYQSCIIIQNSNTKGQTV